MRQYQQYNTHGVLEGKEIWGGKGQRKTSEEIMTKIFPNLMKIINP